MIDYLDAVIEMSKEKQRYFDNYMKYSKLIKQTAEEFLGNAEVILFGSFVEGRHTMASDIDVLIISDNIKDRNEVLVEINKVLGIFHPFELHLITKKEFGWYKRFITDCIRV